MTFVGPWLVADREWFDAHPGRDWYVRDVLPGELDAFSVSHQAPQLELLHQVVELYRREGRPEILRVLVFRLTPDRRLRMPTAARPNEEHPVIHCPDDVTGRLLTVDELLVRLRALYTTTAEPPDLDHCRTCGVAFKTGSATLFYAGYGHCCLGCVRIGAPTAATIYVAEREVEIPVDQWSRDARWRWRDSNRALREMGFRIPRPRD